ncbi:TlpA disulfide reductase family protein [Thalassotalea mangrovi]|uniref:TlpA family protein disulfide reductase n=1 Tax=Thalassotalea mangrovi TaxID=2572245 RepID=A0A4U1BA87_9GAMM|nr:TlpA disulfide reductase family protein [Thalassotalea mangrovi]TKB47047.1 TlpA family protein disulfide reductase [Thalassotalea mangrovi]
MSKAISIFLCSLVVLAGFGLYSMLGQAQSEARSSTGNIAEQQLKQLLEQHQGDVIYLDFWASWCIPCRKSFPWMNEMQSKYQDQGFKVITINLDVDKSFAKEFLKQYPADFTVIYDPEGKIGEAYQLKGMPTSYVIGRDGSVVREEVGFFEDKVAEYEQKLVEILNAQP